LRCAFGLLNATRLAVEMRAGVDLIRRRRQSACRLGFPEPLDSPDYALQVFSSYR
jgi:hypothetical protein